jgi:glycosyl transferase family 25
MTWKIDEIPAQCISLRRRTDRWSAFISQPAFKTLPQLERFDAVDGKTIDVATDKRVLVSTKRNILNKQRRSHEELDSQGGIGCALSHIGIWQMMVQRQIPLLLVFEDDAQIPNRFVEVANKFIEKSPTLQDPSKWDMWLFSNIQQYSTSIPSDPLVHDLQAFVTLTGYVITLKCAEKLLEHAFPIHCHIDHYMVILKQVIPMRYISTPNFRIFQRGLKSDIADKPKCLICNIPTDYDSTHTVISKGDITTLEAIKYIFVLSTAFGAGYILYKRLTGKTPV